MLVARLFAVPLVVVVVVAGVWVAGGLIADSFRLSMVLTGAWLALAGLAALAVGRRARPFRVPVAGAYLLSVLVVGGYLGVTTLRDRVVDEEVVEGIRGATTQPAPARPVEVVAGRFRSHEHATRGRAAVVRLPDGRRFLTLTAFETSPGPDLRVRLVPGRGFDGGVDGAVDLGALKGNRGDQQYRLPTGAGVDRHTVVVWCRAFSAPFGSAPLRG